MAGKRTQGCGTRAGYYYHKRNNSEPCQPCTDAYRTYLKEYNAERYARIKETRQVDSLGRRRPHWHARQKLEPSEDAWKEFKSCGAETAHLFHSNNPDDIKEALKICRGCAVVDECRAEQEFYQAPGVWGGIRWVPTGSSNTQMKVDVRFVKHYLGVLV